LSVSGVRTGATKRASPSIHWLVRSATRGSAGEAHTSGRATVPPRVCARKKAVYRYGSREYLAGE
jgi:hypothetical protein